MVWAGAPSIETRAKLTLLSGLSEGLRDRPEGNALRDAHGASMGDADPVQPGAEIALHLDRQLACQSPEVGYLGGILRRDDERK
jgi:hypothetical protein